MHESFCAFAMEVVITCSQFFCDGNWQNFSFLRSLNSPHATHYRMNHLEVSLKFNEATQLCITDLHLIFSEWASLRYLYMAWPLPSAVHFKDPSFYMVYCPAFYPVSISSLMPLSFLTIWTGSLAAMIDEVVKTVCLVPVCVCSFVGLCSCKAPTCFSANYENNPPESVKLIYWHHICSSSYCQPLILQY